jgi:hypothetical protein
MNLVTAGLTQQKSGTGPGPDLEAGLVRECGELAALLCFVLARELGVDDVPKDGA